MQTITRQPTTLKTRQGDKSYFTLHKYPNSIMAWNTSTSKMAVVAFARHNDVRFMGSTIEHHYTRMREWPDFSGDMKLVAGSGKVKPLDILDVCEWSNLDELRVFCVQKYFDLIIVDKISDTFNITGSIYSLSIPMEAHVPHLEQLFDRE